ncbi:uncharacterized protein DUF4249 [Chitinophaga niastensis]|uniref:Uncharacterized protein DUF4249 n=1 Tax=Chitinophaga niastensis TaxID=536980 RepID=A0A2P8HUQ2_CHINA|nr:DUF4249 domain-containing protein [Chitinophaga niastensis]PSL49960.1 uncharacterized protein DUF4249 [Chitinophaga niastensis]
MQNVFVYAALLVLFFCSCEKRVDIKLPYDGDKIVVNSLIQPDSVIYIRVTRSVPSNVYDDNGFTEITNAAVTLEENGVVLTPLQWQEIKGHGYFVSTQKAILGKQYTVRVAAAGMQPVMATDTLPAAPDVSMAAAQRNSSRVRFTLKDRPDAADFYRIRIFAYGPDGQPDTLRLFRLDPSFNNNMVDFFTSGSNSSLIMNDARFNGKEVNFVLQTQDPIANTTQLMVEVSTLTNDAYQYFKAVSAQERNGGTIITEPVRVFTNVSNGYGIVAGINTKRMTFKVE